MVLTRTLPTLAITVTASVLSAAAIVSSPRAAVGLLTVVAAVGLLALYRDAPVARALVVVLLGVSATLDLLRRIELGPTTAYAWVTGAVVASAALLAVILWTSSIPRPGKRALALGSLFPLWAALSLAWSDLGAADLQNLLLYALFPSTVAVTAAAVSAGAFTFGALRAALRWTFVVGSALYVGSLLLDGAGGAGIVDARAYAAFAAVGVAWTSALGRCGFRFEMRLAVVLLVLSFLSLSRTAFVVAVIVFVGAMFGLRSVRGAGRTLATLLALAALVVAGLHFANPFAARFGEPDAVVLPGGIRLSVSGRGNLWAATWDSALESPIVGSGIGTARVPVSAVLPGSTHPHNDYLRVFHDLGIVGVTLLLAGLLSAAVVSARSLLRGHVRPGFSPAVHIAALLALATLGLEMITDNSLVYPFVIIPVGVIVGASLANSAGRGHALSDAHPL